MQKCRHASTIAGHLINSYSRFPRASTSTEGCWACFSRIRLLQVKFSSRMVDVILIVWREMKIIMRTWLWKPVNKCRDLAPGPTLYPFQHRISALYSPVPHNDTIYFHWDAFLMVTPSARNFEPLEYRSSISWICFPHPKFKLVVFKKTSATWNRYKTGKNYTIDVLMEIDHLAQRFIYSNASLCLPQRTARWNWIMRKVWIDERKTILRKISIHAKGQF